MGGVSPKLVLLGCVLLKLTESPSSASSARVRLKEEMRGGGRPGREAATQSGRGSARQRGTCSVRPGLQRVGQSLAPCGPRSSRGPHAGRAAWAWSHSRRRWGHEAGFRRPASSLERHVRPNNSPPKTSRPHPQTL
uniref:Uncharacterized protein n=1 Tax=Rousettus aegyptiacus TaxID=9407 RepID=A0A7J8C269_ROUAE|nr:hypothetical protein HJG63_009259 [Rousettus aegyptiacus]